MAVEISQIPANLAHHIEHGLDGYRELGSGWRNADLRGFVTCACGSSDHAALFFKYLMETRTGLPVASIRPSVASIYRSRLELDGFVSMSFSQSGMSPDLAQLQRAARSGGARTVSVLNMVDSPLAEGADIVLPVFAGREKAVAATKSFVGMLVASLAVLAGFLKDF